MEESWRVVCLKSDLKNGLGVCALVGEVQVALFKIDGAVYALDNFDPYSRANVISRGIVGDLKGRLVVASPLYKQHFDLETGQCMEDPTVRLSIYPIRVIKDQIEVREQPVVSRVA